MNRLKPLLMAALLLAASAPLAAQLGGRDPLNSKEADQLRELSQEPDKRLKVMLQFARARLATIAQLRGDAKLAADRGSQIHNLLEDFTKLMDEVGDNIDDYAARHADLRKPLREVIEADSEFQLTLRTIKEQGPGAGSAANEISDYNFALQNAIESVNSSLDDSRKLLQEQEIAMKEAKEKEKAKKK
jgi:chromosome segregation ATPase